MPEFELADLAFDRGLLAQRDDRAPDARTSKKPTTREIIAWARASADRAAPWPDLERAQIPCAAVFEPQTSHMQSPLHRAVIAVGGVSFMCAAAAGIALMM